MWFQAAVIAVPIAGVLILIVLVLLAVRMLRSDTRSHNLAAASATKAQLYDAYPSLPPYYPQYGLCAHNEAQTDCGVGGVGGGSGMIGYEKISSDCSSEFSSPHNSLIIEPRHGPGTVV